MEVIRNGGPNKRVPADDPAKYPQEAVQALRMIRARQSEYLRAHPEEGYACRLDQIGEPLNPTTNWAPSSRSLVTT